MSDRLKFNTIDPICGMKVTPDLPYWIEECHSRIVFCSAQCRERYLRSAPKDIDPVCGMHVPASSPYVLNEAGRILRFCNVDCRATYQSRQIEKLQHSQQPERNPSGDESEKRRSGK